MAVKKYKVPGPKKNLYLATRDIRFVNGFYETDNEGDQQYIEEHPFFGSRIVMVSEKNAPPVRKRAEEKPAPKPRGVPDDQVAKMSISMASSELEEEKMPSPPKRSALNSMKKDELVRIANGWGIPAEGTRKDIVSRLVTHFTPLWAVKAKK